MTVTSDLLLTINSTLLGLVGILLTFVGFFLRDLYRQFKTLVDRVNDLHSEMGKQSTAASLQRDRNEETNDALNRRVERIESILFKPQQ